MTPITLTDSQRAALLEQQYALAALNQGQLPPALNATIDAARTIIMILLGTKP